MLNLSTSSLIYDSARRSASDWLLGGIGFSAAAVSASFAIYMVAVGPGALAGRTDDGFNIFVQWDRRLRTAAMPEAIVAQQQITALAPPEQSGGPTGAADLDFTPTGSISASSGNPKLTLEGHPDADAATPDRRSRRLQSFVLRDVFDGKAVIESGNKLHLVEPGSMLDDAGEVLAIRRIGGGWVVETSGGTIRNDASPVVRR